MSRTKGVRFTNNLTKDETPVSPSTSLLLMVGGGAGTMMFEPGLQRNISMVAALTGMALYVKAYFLPTQPPTLETLM